MAPCTTLSSYFVNSRAYSQKRAWKTHYELQESATAAAGAANSNESIVDLERRTDGSSTRQGKRGQEGGSPGGGGTVVRRLGPHDYRLTETYGRSPPDAFLIEVPKAIHDDDWCPDHSLEMPRPFRRGHQPTNTLDQSAPQASGGFFGIHAHQSRPTALSTQTIKGDNVHRVEDVFEKHQAGEPNSKRQKMNPPRRPLIQSSPRTMVDLTDDGEDEVYFAGIPHSRARGGSTATQRARCRGVTHSDDPFAMGEAAQADSFTSIPKQSNSAKIRANKMRRSGSQHSSVQGSARSPTTEAPDSRVEDRSGTRNSPMVIDGEEKRASLAQKSNQRPLIALGANFPELKLQSQKPRTKVTQGSQQDLQNANRMFSISRLTNEEPRLPRRVQQGGNGDDPGHLRYKFKREEATARQPKARERMRAVSAVSVREGSSPDELEGARTVVSHGSPHKDSNTAAQSSARNNVAQQHRVLPSGYHQGSSSRVASPPSDDSEDVTDETRIPIRSIISRQCIQQQKSLALVWDDKDQCFFVACGETLVRLPLRDELVAIGKRDVTINLTRSHGTTKAILKGSSTGLSNGTVLIEFQDEDGLNLCHDYLLSASGDTMRTQSVLADYMEKAFQQQSKILSIAHQKLLGLGPPILAGATSRRAGGQAFLNDDEENYQYEDEPGTLSEIPAPKQHARATEEQSHHFQQDATRRSTRQIKQTRTKPRSPSPLPRWSHNNDPPVWQHPVVYPSQGTRRVTVYDSDVYRLDEGEYLNDNLLGFAIRNIEEKMEPIHKNKVHFFNTFFYSSLMKNNKRVPDYEAVKRWTKNTDIFSIPYTVVPINNDLHWYFAIICNLGFLARKPLGTDEEDFIVDGVTNGTSESVAVDREAVEELPPRSDDQPGDSMDEVIIYEDDDVIMQARDDAASSRPSTATGTKLKKTKPRVVPPTRKFDITTPVIIMLDSFGHARTAESTNLKKYIRAEAKEKRAMDVQISEIQGVNAKGLPAQPNFCDCGVFVIGYLMEFAKNPDAFVKKVLQRDIDAEKDFKDFSAPNLRNRIRDELFKVANEQAEERRALKAQKKARNARTSTPANVSKQSSPAPQLPAAPEILNAAIRVASTPAPPGTRSLRSSPVPTSRTTPRSSVKPATSSRAAGAVETEDELEVSAPTALTHAYSAPSPPTSGSSQPDTDDEMLDVPANASAPRFNILPNAYGQSHVSSTGNPFPLFTNKKASSAGSVVGQEEPDTPGEVPDSQGLQ